MRIQVTVNIGNGENITVESGEYEYPQDCKKELYGVLMAFNEARIDDFCKRMFKDLLYMGGIK